MKKSIDEACLRMVRNDSGLRERFHEMLASGNATLHRYDGETPLHMVITFDDRVQICGHVDDGPPPGSVESTESTVLAWARSYFEDARAASDPIGIETLTPGAQESS